MISAHAIDSGSFGRYYNSQARVKGAPMNRFKIGLLLAIGSFFLTGRSDANETLLTEQERIIARVFSYYIKHQDDHLNAMGAIGISRLMESARSMVTTRDPYHYVLSAMDATIYEIERGDDPRTLLWAGSARAGKCRFIEGIYYEHKRALRDEGRLDQIGKFRYILHDSTDCFMSLYDDYRKYYNADIRYFSIYSANMAAISCDELEDEDTAISIWKKAINEFSGDEYFNNLMALTSIYENLEGKLVIQGDIPEAVRHWRARLLIISQWPGANRAELLQGGMYNALRRYDRMSLAGVSVKMHQELCRGTAAGASVTEADAVISKLCIEYPWPPVDSVRSSRN
jgi:tetratricopeptide (TPR) repeat protein